LGERFSDRMQSVVPLENMENSFLQWWRGAAKPSDFCTFWLIISEVPWDKD
jgi:hypothetical protein